MAAEEEDDENPEKSRKTAAEEENPELTTCFLWTVTFSWLTPLIRLGRARPLEETDLFPLASIDRVGSVHGPLDAAWARERASPAPSLFRALRRAYGRRFVAAGALKLLSDINALLQPLLLYAIVDVVSSADAACSKGYMWSGLLFASMLFGSLVIQMHYDMVQRVGIHVRIGITSMIYRKALAISPQARNMQSSGEIVNFCAIDANRLEGLATVLHSVWSCILEIAGSLVGVFVLTGWPALCGLVVMLVVIPLQGRLMRRMAAVRKQQQKLADERVKTMNEIIQGIRVIKFNAWERPFWGRLNGIRENELAFVLKGAILRAFNVSLMVIAPALVTLVTFGSYVLAGNTLQPYGSVCLWLP